jgi:parvulin-like peptidyl-prolyl isomerase
MKNKKADKRWINFLAMILILLIATGCSQTEEATVDENIVVAQVGTVKIYQKQVEEYGKLVAFISGLDLDEMESNKKQEFQKMILEQLVEDFLIMEHLDAKQSPVLNEEEMQNLEHYLESIYFNDEIQSELDRMGVSEETVKHYYLSERYYDIFVNQVSEEDEALRSEALNYFEANRNSLIEVETNHVLVSSEAEALEVLEQLKGGTEFGSLAKKYSKDTGTTPEGFAGANLLNSLLPEYAMAVQSLKPKEISMPIKTTDGYYIIQLLEYRNEFDDFDETIRRMLVKSKLEVYTKALKEEVSVELYES